MRGISSLPIHARVIVCGSGVVGNSVAYHLAEHGWTDVVVLDRGKIGSGTSWQGSGLIGQFRSVAERPFVTYGAQLYAKLQEQGHLTGWSQCGSLNVARTRERWTSLRRFVAVSHAEGTKCELVDPTDMRKLHPYLNTSDLEGGVWVPLDGTVNSKDVCLTLAKCAQAGGADYIENCTVERILTENGRIKGVKTSKGYVQCEYLVNCTGLWARELSENCEPKVRTPVHAAEHFVLTTGCLPSSFTILRNSALPVVRDYDGGLYCREQDGGFLAGGFSSKPVFHEELGEKFTPEQTDMTKRLFGPLVQSLIARIPVMKHVTITNFYNGPENFSADGKWILGETPEVGNYFVAVGMNGNSVQAAAGVGRAVADWIIDGEPTADLLPFDIRRFRDLHNNKKFLRERVQEIASSHYKLAYPMHSEFESARKIRASPLYSEQEAAGAVFGEVMGFERALYFDTTPGKTSGLLPAKMAPATFAKPGWFDFVRDEYYACREGVGIIDFSSLTKFELKSPGTEVVDFLQLMCSTDVNIPVGNMVSTGMQNENGGFENDCLLLRRAENYFLMICPAIQHTRMMEWMSRHLPLGGSVDIGDVSSMYTVINLVGPKSKELMTEMTNVEFSVAPFTCKEVNLGYASEITTLGFTHVGEPGYSLFVPSEYAIHIYKRLMEAGDDYGIRNVGHFANRFLRIEKFVPFWGEELDSNTTPYEVGRGHRVKLEKDYFWGKFALAKQLETGVTRRLVHFTLEGHDPDTDLWAWGDEPIYRDGVFVGRTTSAGYGFTLNSIVCMGFVKDKDPTTAEDRIVTSEYVTRKQSRYEIDIASKRFAARASVHPPKMPQITLDSMKLTYVPKAKKRLVVSEH